METGGVEVEEMDMDAQMTSDGEGSQSMDARLWGQLQNYIDLGTLVYVKVPIGDFFRLRVVCKEWNQLASDREFLERTFRDPIAKPYFVVGTSMTKSRLLTYDRSSRCWSSTRVPSAFSQVEGVFIVGWHNRRIFNVHTRVFYDPPPPPKTMPSFPSFPIDLSDEEDWEKFSYDAWNPWGEEPLMGITVDTSARPYTFQLIVGDQSIDTRIYDSTSNSWTHNRSCLTKEHGEFIETSSCAQCNGFLYIWAWSTCESRAGLNHLHMYNLEDEEWVWNSPSIPHRRWQFCDVGAWQDRLFFFGAHPINRSQSGYAITVYELFDHSEDSWTVFDRMPDYYCLYILGDRRRNLGNVSYRMRFTEMRSIFCGEHVLVYNCIGVELVIERAVLFNLNHKRWKIVEIPISG